MRVGVPASSEFDAEIEVQVSKRAGAWSFTLQPGFARQIRATGRVTGKGATRHTLLAVGITSALMAVNEREHKRLRADKPKPRVVIDVPDGQFIRALEFRRKSKATPNDGFRVSRHLLRPLYEQLRRFDVTFRFLAQTKQKAATDLTPAERMTRYWYSFDADVFTPSAIEK